MSIAGIVDFDMEKLKVYLSALELEDGLIYVNGLSENTMLNGLFVVLIVRLAGMPASGVGFDMFVAYTADVFEMIQWNSDWLAINVDES